MRRTVASIVAIALLLVGAGLLLVYANGADRRALEKYGPAKVLIVVSPIPKGTSAAQIGTMTEMREIPRAAVAQEAVSSIRELGSKVASTELRPGEQVLSTRFVEPKNLEKSFEVPANSMQISVMLDPQRVMGGTIKPGDRVGIIITTASKTKLALNQILVTDVRGAQPAATSTKSPSTADPAKGNVLLTFAVRAPEAEVIVFGAESGKLWVTLENEQTTAEGSRAVDEGTVMK